MATLINRIQRAMLGSAGPDKVRALLAELQIPAGGSGGSMREVRRGVLRPISDEAILRDALGDLGLTGGGGGGAQALSSIRTAILHNLVDSETTLRDGLDGLLAPGDLAGEGGGDGGPAWVPENAKIHIDLVGGSPQGRAWTEADGEVAIDTLLGSDPNAENAWGTTGYDPANLTTADEIFPVGGYVRSDGNAVALIGGLRDVVLAGATIRAVWGTRVPGPVTGQIVVVSADGNSAVEMDLANSKYQQSSWTGTMSAEILDCLNESGSEAGLFNCMAVTITPVRCDGAANGFAAVTAGLTTDDYPTSGDSPIVAALIDMNESCALQSITIYDPLPDTTGLSELSEP